jgi:hypothetical protein
MGVGLGMMVEESKIRRVGFRDSGGRGIRISEDVLFLGYLPNNSRIGSVDQTYQATLVLFWIMVASGVRIV